MNKYYEMFMNDKVDETLFKVNNNALTFEDHFWHYACMSLYYKQKNDYYMHKKCLTAACDLNYYYNAFLYFDAFNVLPQNFKKCVKPFEHKMKNDKLEDLIAQANKYDKKDMKKGFLLYSLGSLLIIPLMLILVLLGIDTTIAAIISIVILFFGQSFINPLIKQRKQVKNMKRDTLLTKEEKSYFNYVFSFDTIMRNEKYIALIKAKNDEERDMIIDLIKTNRPLPAQTKEKKKVKK